MDKVIAIVGDEQTGVTVGDEKINLVIERLLDRIIKKYPTANFIIGDHPGVEKLTQIQLKNKNYNYLGVRMYLLEKEHLQQAIEFMVDFADNVVVITNGQKHYRLDTIKELANGKCLIYNYLLDKEKMF